jgi:hypothetical protein
MPWTEVLGSARVVARIATPLTKIPVPLYVARRIAKATTVISYRK